MTSRKKFSDLDSYPATKAALKLKLGVTNLEENQYSGVVVYSTYADLPVTGTLLVSYKVSNDPDTALNGYYHWTGSAYLKDASLVEDDIEIENNSDAISGAAVGVYSNSKWFSKDPSDLALRKPIVNIALYDQEGRRQFIIRSAPFSTSSDRVFFQLQNVEDSGTNDNLIYLFGDTGVQSGIKRYLLSSVANGLLLDVTVDWNLYDGQKYSSVSPVLNTIKKNDPIGSIASGDENAVSGGDIYSALAVLESDIALDETLNDDILERGALDGAVVTATGFDIPTGEIGYNSYTGARQSSVPEDIYVGQIVTFNVVLKITNYLDLSVQAIRDPYLRDKNNVLQTIYTLESSDVIDGDDLIRTYVIKYKITQANIDDDTYIRSFFKNYNTDPLPSGSNWTIESHSIYTTKTVQGELDRLDAEDANLQSQINDLAVGTLIYTAKKEGVAGVDADVIGWSGLQNLILGFDSSVGDVEIQMKGIWTAEVSDYIDAPNYGDGAYCLIPDRDGLTIRGEGKDVTKVFAFAASTGLTTPEWRDLNIAVVHKNMTFKDVGLYQKNGRYPIHTYGGAASNKTILFERCNIVAYGNFDDAFTNWSAPRPFGVGYSSGLNFKVKDCFVHSQQTTVIIHGSNYPFDLAGVIQWENIEVSQSYNLADDVNLYSQGSETINPLIINSTYLERGIVITDGVWTSTDLDKQFADHIEFDLQMKDNLALPVRISGIDGIGLKIESLSTGASSSVLFDIASSAYEDIIGDSSNESEFINRLNLREYAGQMYKVGGDGLAAWSCGVWSIQEEPIGAGADVYITSLGKRLGDCSVTSKTLTINIDGTDYNVVFNSDYTNVDNATIIAEINAVIGVVGLASEYTISREYYPTVKGLKKYLNASSEAIFAGMGFVKVTLNRIRKATNADGYIDGICLDDGAIGEYVRCVEGRGLKINAEDANQRFALSENAVAERSIGDVVGISAVDDGVFELNAVPSLLRCYDTNKMELL